MTMIPAEQETTIKFNEAEWWASVETFSGKVAARLKKAGIGDTVERSAILVKVGKRSIRLAGQSKAKDVNKPITDEAYSAETIIGFDEEDPFARIHTASIMVCKRLKKAGLTPNPAETQTINGVESDWVFIVPKQHISIKEAKEKCYIAGKPRKKASGKGKK